MPLSLLLATAMLEAKSLRGFSPSAATAEFALEAKFDSALDGKDQSKWMRRLTLHPHHVGSPWGLENAKFMRDLYAAAGWDAKIETFKVLFAEPKERFLEIGGYRAKLEEPLVKGDSASALAKEALPLYNCYSCDGDVTGKLVYVNYGVPKDYDILAERGIDVKGKIVIARYGGAWRGTKPKVAAEHGAIGCIIYSDPRDDGFYQGDTYPKGAWRNTDSGQRGSVADMPVFPGDPLTPGVGATDGAMRLAMKDAPTITKIPVLPIGYGDAQHFLADLEGPVAPEGWRGGLPFTYHIGPSSHSIHLRLAFNWKMVEARDVIARIPGSEKPDDWVIRGNHHDAWVTGADDPISGQVALLDEAKAIGALLRTGWRPKRTLIYCSWDGEEPGLLGSTEWCETHAEELSKHAVAYINSDSNGRGFAGVGGSHYFEPFVNEVLRDVTDPETKLSALDRMRARNLVGSNAEAKERSKKKEDEPIGALGSGSDFSPFLQHLGIGSMDVGFGGEGEGTQYHSTYDSFEWFNRFVDPGHVYGVTLSKTAGRIALRLANAEEAPLDFSRFAKTVEGYVKEIEKSAKAMREETAESNAQLADGTYKATQDPKKNFILPQPKSAVPDIDFTPLEKAVEHLKTAAAKAKGDGLWRAERTLLGPGLPKRPWYRHTVYAPGLYTGYGVKTIPGVREAIEERQWNEVPIQIMVAADALDRLAYELGK